MAEQHGEASGPPSDSGAHATQSLKGQMRLEELTRAERTLARRVAESRATVPDLELRSEVEMSACAALRSARNGTPSLTGLLVKACALALRAVPRANGAYRDGCFELYSRVNCGIAVADGRACAMPTLFDADRKSPDELSAELREVLTRVRRGELTAPGSAGATFTLLNSGASGPTDSTIAITPPHAVAISAGAIRSSPIVRDGTIVVGSLMTLTLVCDARIVYGTCAAELLATAKRLLEHPESL